jgi:hypothetical protein
MEGFKSTSTFRFGMEVRVSGSSLSASIRCLPVIDFIFLEFLRTAVVIGPCPPVVHNGMGERKGFAFYAIARNLG